MVFSKINVQRNHSYSVTNKMKKNYSAILGSSDLLIKTKHYDEHVKYCVQNCFDFYPIYPIRSRERERERERESVIRQLFINFLHAYGLSYDISLVPNVTSNIEIKLQYF